VRRREKSWSRLAVVLLALLLGCSPAPVVEPRAAAESPAPTASAVAPPTKPSLVERSPAPSPQLRADETASIDRAVEGCIRRSEIPGAVVVVIRDRQVALRKAYGHRRLEPKREPMTLDTLFDLASLTKPIVTATAIAILVQQGKLRLDDPVAKHLPSFAAHGKSAITVAQLLDHSSGMAAVNSLRDYASGRETAVTKVLASKARRSGTRRYSDLGYITLGALVEKLSGLQLDDFARRQIFEPIGMNGASFNPSDTARAAPSDRRDGAWLRGRVHDPRAAALGGVAGHAGLFATADDVAAFALMMLRDGEALLEPANARRLHAARPGKEHALAYSRTRGGYGHTGFTGTSLWLDPKRGSGVILLSNRLHPSGIGDARPLRREVRDAVIAADRAREKDKRLLTGIDVLRRDGFAALRGHKVGLVTNHTGRAADGSSTIDLIHQASGVSLVALFSPEHGIRGEHDEAVANARDKTTGLPIYSLYGNIKRPSAAQLRGIDTLVFDIQDIGARFYTYISTLGYLLETAAKHRLRVVVLDRPNPIGSRVAGPLLDGARRSFIGYHTLPVQHGMTVGELARMFNAERKLGAELTVVELEGWTRTAHFDAAKLPWVNPSPNIRSLQAALLYPGIALLEATNVSVGRGTETPFQRVGAPWLDAAALARALSGVAGLKVEAIRFTPTSSRHAGKLCHGVSLEIVNADAIAAVRLGVTIAHHLRQRHRADWHAAQLLLLLGNRASFDALIGGASVDSIAERWQGPLAAFERRRRGYLLY
jgi:uncharacterized protein YbbC (DUF1343 family)/CubicO group peptidase (beta-lactamase class C family)